MAQNALAFLDEEEEKPKQSALDFLDSEPTAEEFLDQKDEAPGLASKLVDALKFETKRQLAPISGVVDKFKNLTTPEIPDANDPRRQMLGQAIKSALPALTDPNAPEALKELAAAGAYEVAGAVKGATLGYVDPVPLLEKTPLAKADISKPIAVGAGQFVGALAPISVISRGIGLTLKASGLLNGVRPVLQGLVHSGVTGAIFGASSKTENSEESQITQRAHQALNDAAGFIVFTGAAQLVDKAAKALSSGNKANFNDYQVFRKSVIDTFVSKGANPEDAARMADVGIDAAVKSGGGWGDVTKGDLLKAQEAIKKGQKIIIEQPISGAGEPNVSTTQMPVKTPRTQPAPASSLKDLSSKAQNVVSTRFPILGKALAEKPIPMAPGELQATLTRGVAAGEEVLLRGGTPEEANIAALKSFAQDVKPIIEKNVPQQKFMGRLEPGEMYGDKVITGNFNRKMDAIAHAEQTGGKVEGYLSGKFKRGWVVKNVPRETNLGRGLTENPTSEQAGVSTLKPLPPFETKPPEKAMEAPIQQYKATEVGKDIESRAFETFGETKVLRDAGFVMPSGKMVDFTKGTGNRLYSHYDAARELTGKEDNLYDMIDQMKAVRVVHYSDLNGENISFQARGPLSTDQLNAVRDYYAENKVSHSNLEIVDGSGHQVRAKSIDKPTIEDISQFFNGTSLMEKPAISRYDFNTGKMVEVKKPGQKEDMGVNSPYEEKLPQEQGKTSPEVSPMRESFKAIQGARFETEFRETGAVVVPNKKLNTPADAAYVFRQFRNPVQEGFSLIALKNGRVVGVEYIGFGTIDQVATYPFNTLHILDKTQADSVYISHNHPSGEVIPSEEDKRLTRMMKDVFDNHDVKFNGHVIINDTKFGFIDGNGNVSEGVHQEYAQTKTVPVLQKFYKWKEGMDKPGPYLTSPKSVFELHKGIQKDPNEGVLFLLDTQNRIINTVIVPKDQITPKVLQRIVSLYRPAGIVSASSGIDSRQVRAAKEAMRNLDVRYHDDILVDGDQYQSKLESGLMEPRAQYGAKKWGGKVWETEISPFTDEPGTEGMRYKPGTLERTPNIKVNSLDITPSMKESVLTEGQPQYKAVIKPSDSKKEIPKDIYEANRQLNGNRIVTPRTSASEYGKSLKDWFDKFLGTISTRLYNINPKLKYALRKFSFDVKRNTMSDMKEASDFMGKISKMSKEEQVDFDLAQKNGDGPLMFKLATKHGFSTDYFKMRNVLNKIHQRARDVGFDVGYLENYFPRVVADKKGFMQYFMNSEGWSQIKQAIEAKEASLGKILNEDEKISLINSMIRGYQNGKISLSQLGNMKDRAIDFISPELNRFYYPSNSSLIRYLEKTNELIEARKFFGKGSKELEYNNVDQTIGAYTLDLLAKGEITPEQEQELSDILKSRFNYKSMGGWLGLYKNIEYLDTLGSVSSAITQIEDLAVPLALHGNLNTIKNLPKVLLGKSEITMKDLGLEDIAEEFRDQTKLAKAMKKVFTATGFTAMDRIGKELTVNAAISKLRYEARNPEPLFIRDMGYMFGDKAPVVIEDLRTGKTTDDIKFLAFNEILDVQPVDLMEMPQGYLENPNGRIAYMLKSFTLKRLDLYRNKVFKKINSNDWNEKKEGIGNLIKLMLAVVFVGAGVDEIKDIVFNRTTSLSDRMVDNIAKIFGLSKYTVYKARQEGLGRAVGMTIAPPVKIVDALIKDISHAGDGKGLASVESVPLVGKLYSNWFGYGAKRTALKRKKMFKKPSLKSKPKTFMSKSLTQNVAEYLK